VSRAHEDTTVTRRSQTACRAERHREVTPEVLLSDLGPERRRDRGPDAPADVQGLACIQRAVFTRKAETYDFDPAIVSAILADDTAPLGRIARLIPSGSRILDIGAGSGLLPLVFHELRKQVMIDGIEPDTYAAQLARPHYNNLYTGFAQDLAEVIAPVQYDFLILADVIEHTPDPLSFLAGLHQLQPHARLVLSIPNIAFGAVRLSLLDGSFEYVDSGLLERTHLRFFTLDTFQNMVSALGMHINTLIFLKKDIFQTEIPLKKCEFGLRTLVRVLRDELASTYQFLAVLSAEASVTEKRSYGRALTLRSYLHRRARDRFRLVRR
jgi:2-polyprenyl-3-methyl-5-hydroxy-6-metoxy-1,4-benzoquinol methylase